MEKLAVRTKIWFVYVIARAGVEFSCSEKNNFAVITTASGIYPKISLLPVLSQSYAIASLAKVKYLFSNSLPR